MMQNAEKLSNKKKIDVIAQNSEKFINIGFDSLSVKDSFSFITASLDKLVSMTKYDNTDEKDRRKWVLRDDWQSNFGYSSKNDIIKLEKCLDLLTEKGVYPYDYMNAFDKFNDEQLPSKEQFYSRLTEEDLTNDDYNKAKQIWNHFGIKSMGEYHDLYLKTDVLLLTVFENFRDMCLSYYGLDPVYYYTLPNFAFDAMLKLTNVEIDLVYDQEMYEMIEAGLRGRMTQTTCKKVEAGNKYMGSDYDKNKASSYINYLDANNLYGLSMIQKLPYRNLKWDDKITEEDIINYDNDGNGFILEVDLEYPKELHDLHNDYPLAPEVKNVKSNLLSEEQVEIYKLINGSKEPKDEKTNKLILNLNDKNKYVVHIRTLQFYLKHGLKLKKTHRAIKFEQKEILKPYIEFNTEKRKNARNDFEKDMFKLLNDAVFGKTMEDKRKHLDFEIVSDEKRFMKCVNNPSFKHSHIINENLVGVEKQKPKLKLDKPIFIGMSILDLSKQHMYRFYFDVIKPKYGDNIRMVYTDTDSFVFHTKTDDIYADLKDINDEMDFSGYDENHKCYDAANKKVLGKIKGECEGKIMTGFIGLRPKWYAFKIHGDDQEYKKCKGTAKNTVKRKVKYDDYNKVLETNEVIHRSFNSIRSKNHKIYSIHTTKVSLNSYEYKRYWTTSVDSLAYGHYKINDLKNE